MKKRTVVLFLGLILVSFCMRAPMSAVGPVVSQIKDSLHLSSGFAGLLTTIPMIIFGLAAPLADRLMNRVRDEVLMPISLVVTAGGMVLRSYGGIVGLLVGTVCIGMGIAVLNVALPVFVRGNFPGQIGLAMGIYTMALSLFSALGAGFALPFTNALGSWNAGLAIFGVLPVFAVVAWLWAAKHGFAPHEKLQNVPLSAMIRKKKSWWMALFMAFQSILFYCCITWLPSILTERGATDATAGYLLLAMQLVSLITNFLMPLMLQWFTDKRGQLGILCAVVYGSGLVLQLPLPVPLWVTGCGVILLGLGSGLSFSYAMTMITLQGKDHQETAELSTFAQGAGYLIAAPLPAVLGLLFDASASFTLPVVLLIGICVPMAVFGYLSAGKKEPVRH